MSQEFYQNYCRSNKIAVDQNIIAALSKSCATREVCLNRVTLNTQNCGALGVTISTFPDINSLDLSNSLSPIPGFCELFDKLHNCNLNALNLKGNNLYGNAIVRLGKLLSKNTSIKVLVLEWNNIGEPLQSFAQFCYSLTTNSTLEELDIRNNQLNSECATELADIISKNTSLKEIDIRWNSIGVEGGKILLEALNYNNTLTVIRIQGNDIPCDIVSAIDNFVKHNCTVQKISNDYAARQDILTKQIECISKKRIEDFKIACEQGAQQLKPCLDKIKEYSVERQEFVKEIEHSKLKISQLEELVTGLRLQLDCANKQIDSKQELIKEHEKTIGDIQERAEVELNNHKTRASEEERRLKKEIEHFQEVVEKEKRSRLMLEKQLCDCQLTIENLIKETEELKDRVNHITSTHNKVLDEERKMHKESLNQLLQEMKSEQEQSKKLCDKVRSECQEKISELQCKLEESEKCKQAASDLLLNERSNWSKDKEYIIAEASEKQAEIRKLLDRKLSGVMEEKLKLEEELAKCQITIKMLTHENESEKSEKAQCVSRISMLQQQLNESNIRLDHIQHQQSQITHLEDKLKDEAEKYRKELLVAHRTISELQMENSKLIDKHRKEVNELNDKLQEKIDDISKIRSEELERGRALCTAIQKYIGGRY